MLDPNSWDSMVTPAMDIESIAMARKVKKLVPPDVVTRLFQIKFDFHLNTNNYLTLF